MKKKELFIVISSNVNDDTILSAVKTALISAGHKGELAVIDQRQSKDYPRYNTGNRRVLISEHICGQAYNCAEQDVIETEKKWTFRPPVMVTAPTYDDFVNVAVVGPANTGKTVTMVIINNQLVTLGLAKENIQISCLDGAEHHARVSEFIADHAEDILKDMPIKILVRQFPISGEFPALDAVIKGRSQVDVHSTSRLVSGNKKLEGIQTALNDALAKYTGMENAAALIEAMEGIHGVVEGSDDHRFAMAMARFHGYDTVEAYMTYLKSGI